MKNRKRGFSLVELLIVLAVIAALIATITPVALNAIRKSKATQVAQNLKTLASALENAAYVNGTHSSGYVMKPDENAAVTLAELGRDIDDSLYGIEYTKTTNWAFEAVVYYKGTDVDTGMVEEVLRNATSTRDWNYDVPDTNKLGTSIPATGQGMFYTFTFSVY